MSTSKQSLLIMLLVLPALACKQDLSTPGTSSRPQSSTPLRFDAENPGEPAGKSTAWVQTAEEKKLIDGLVSDYPSDKAAAIRRSLSTPQHRLSLVDDPKGQAMLDSIYEGRRHQSELRSEDAPLVVTATAVLVDSLPERGAAAVIVRRAFENPHDLLLLPAASASPELMTATVNALYRIRDREGDVPSRNSRIGIQVPTQSLPVEPNTSPSRGDIIELRRAALRHLSGLGMVRSISIGMVGRRR